MNARGDEPRPSPRLPPAATYSIVARCPETGQLGVGVQSHHFSVGAMVPWGAGGVGVVATQSFARAAYGPGSLAALAGGSRPREALDALLAADPGRALRQVAVLAASGEAAVHTGTSCVGAAGHRIGEGYAVQGNMLASEQVWQVMAEAFETSSGATGDLAERILLTLEAAEAAGGDLRGRQSAALLVVTAEPPAEAGADRLFDLRVEDHPDPLGELRRLLAVARAYRALDAASLAAAAGDLDEARAWLDAARSYKPGEPEFAFWGGVALATAGHRAEALSLLREAYAAGEGWRELARRLQPMGLLPNDPELVKP